MLGRRTARDSCEQGGAGFRPRDGHPHGALQRFNEGGADLEPSGGTACVRSPCCSPSSCWRRRSARPEDDTSDADVETFPLILRTDDRPDVLTTTVVDARNGRPIAGATVRGYAESIDGRAAAVNALLLTMKTDAYGLAVGQVDTKALGASHWIVSAEGYRPYAEYHGFWPPERVDLEPATPVAVRVLGPYGEPVAGALVEGYSGCPHAPPAVRDGRTRTACSVPPTARPRASPSGSGHPAARARTTTCPPSSGTSRASRCFPPASPCGVACATGTDDRSPVSCSGVRTTREVPPP